MYFPPLVWNNILDYLGIWEETYNKIVKKLSKISGISCFPVPVGYIYINDPNEPIDYSSDDLCDLWVIQKQMRVTKFLKKKHGYNIATYWMEPYIRHHNRAMGRYEAW